MAKHLLISFRKDLVRDMNIFGKEVFIRLADDCSGFACTTQYGKIFSKRADFPLNVRPVRPSVDETAALPVNSRPSPRIVGQVIPRSHD